VWGAGHEIRTTGEPVRLDDLSILVVDDQRDSRETIAALLEQRGATVLQTDSAESALEALQTERVCVIVADIAMPRIDGHELMRRVRAGGNGVPAVAVTAFARSDDRHAALQSGFTAYLAKPIDENQLARIVRDLGGVPAAV